jgi:NitT/TauT family transport system substrate-binding protein
VGRSPTKDFVNRFRRFALRVPIAARLIPAVLALACACGGATSTGGVQTVTIAYFPNLTHAVGLVAVANGLAKQALAPHEVEVRAFSAGPQLIEALLSGDVDIGYVGPSPAVNGFVKSRGEAVRVIAGASSGGALFVARGDTNLRSAADLAGKRFATPQRGGTQDVALRHLARGSGLKTSDEGGPVTIIPMQNADILTAFRQGQIDGAWVPEPWATRLVREAGATVWFDERTRWPEGKFATTHVVVSRTFLDAHPDLVTAFLRAHVEATRFVVDKPAEAKTIANREIARITTAAIPVAVLDAAWEHIDFTYDPLAATVEVMATHAFELGFLGDTRPDLRTFYALGPLNAVLREQGLPIVPETRP